MTLPLLSVVYFNKCPAACVIIPLICPTAFMEWNLRHLVCEEAHPGSSSKGPVLPLGITHTHILCRHTYYCISHSSIHSSLIISLHGSSLAMPRGLWHFYNLILYHSVAGPCARGWSSLIDANYLTFYLKIALLIQTN